MCIFVAVQTMGQLKMPPGVDIMMNVPFLRDPKNKRPVQPAKPSPSYSKTRCNMLFKTPKKPCKPGEGLANLITFTNAYCFNNGSYICKAFAGRFEFMFNVKENKWLGKVPESKYVDRFGYHKRVPINYDIDGKINYADQSINWARQWAGVTNQNNKVNLLSINEFNWCAYVKSNYWPYKSAIKKGPYTIYFFNRQSCIFKDGVEDKKQHYNTRFLHLSKLRIDIDINPTIFAMEDPLAKGDQLRLVKHKRQHWYEVEFNVVENPTPNITYFVKMKDTETLPCTIRDASGPLLNKQMLEKVTDVCMDDGYQDRATGAKNGQLVEAHCGYDQTESADMTLAEFKSHNRAQQYEVDVHCLPYYPYIAQSFFGINIPNKEYWESFKAMVAFTAVTSIPRKEGDFRVLMFFSKYGVDVPRDVYDEFYPKPYFSDYIAKPIYSPDGKEIIKWESKPEANARYVPNLNYVDDIAYLHKCDSVLIVFGPLYTEMLASQFSVDKRTVIEPIYHLGLQEPTNCFLAAPDSNIIYFYHRTNWIVKHEYKCGKPDKDILVTAERIGKYKALRGQDRVPLFQREIFGPISHDPNEEYLFRLMGLYKGSIVPEAPDAAKYPLPELPVPPPLKNNADYTWVYILIGVAILLILLLCIICIFTLRRRNEHRRKHKKAHSNMPSTMTARSGLQSARQNNSNISAGKTGRSALQSGASRSSLRAKPTERSANLNNKSQATSISRSARSQMGRSRPGRSVRSNLSASSKAKGSGVSRTPTQRSSSMSAGSQRSNKK